MGNAYCLIAAACARMGPMTQAPPKVPAIRVSEFYERKRRLAYRFAWLSMVFLFLDLAFGFLLDFYKDPRAAASGDGTAVLHRSLTREASDGSRLVLLDAGLKERSAPLPLLDSATALLPETDGVTVFYGSRAAVVADRSSARSVDLGQTWDVLAALQDPARDIAWSFGWNDGKILARRREKGIWSAPLAVADAPAVERISASIDGTAGPLVAWREKDSPKVKTTVYDGSAFKPGAEFDIADAQHWDAAIVKDRVLVAFYNRADRSFEYVTLRLECCPGCASPAPSRRIRFTDPVLLLGRKVTGLSMLLRGDRLRFFTTRTSTLMTAAVPLATLQPEPGSARLVAVGSDPVWRHAGAALAPLLMVFFSFSMMFLGFTLLRERSRAAQPAASLEVPLAETLQRGMAYILDLILLAPLFLLIFGLVGLEPGDLDDPQLAVVFGLALLLEFVYHVLMEWRLGWTLGKRILGIRVTELDGSPLTLRGAILRNLLRVLDSQFPFGLMLGVILILKTRRRQRLGDLIARTMVLQDRSP